MKSEYSTAVRRAVAAVALGLALIRVTPAQAEPIALDQSSSRIRFEGHSNTHEFRGSSYELEGRLDVDWQQRTLLAGGDIRIPISGFKTGNDARDHAMQHMFDMTRSPDIVFTVERIVPVDATKGHYRLEGTLSVHDRKQPAVLEATAVFDEDSVRVSGEYLFDVEAFGMTPPKMLGVFRVKKDVLVTFETTWRKNGG